MLKMVGIGTILGFHIFITLFLVTNSRGTISRKTFRYQFPNDYYGGTDRYNEFYNNYVDRYGYDPYRPPARYEPYPPPPPPPRYEPYPPYQPPVPGPVPERYDPLGPRYIGPETFPGKYLGVGKVNLLYGGRDAELICTLTTGADVVSNPVWTKIEGGYPDYPGYQVLDFDDVRFSHHLYQGSSIVLIRDVRPTDFGVYRCVASAQMNPYGDTETVFQILEFFRN